MLSSIDWSESLSNALGASFCLENGITIRDPQSAVATNALFDLAKLNISYYYRQKYVLA